MAWAIGQEWGQGAWADTGDMCPCCACELCDPSNVCAGICYPKILHVTITNVSGCACLAGTYEIDNEVDAGFPQTWDIPTDDVSVTCHANYVLWSLALSCTNATAPDWQFGFNCGFDDGNFDYDCSGFTITTATADVVQCSPLLLQWNSVAVAHGGDFGDGVKCPSGSCCDGNIKIVITT